MSRGRMQRYGAGILAVGMMGAGLLLAQAASASSANGGATFSAISAEICGRPGAFGIGSAGARLHAGGAPGAARIQETA